MSVLVVSARDEVFEAWRSALADHGPVLRAVFNGCAFVDAGHGGSVLLLILDLHQMGEMAGDCVFSAHARFPAARVIATGIPLSVTNEIALLGKGAAACCADHVRDGLRERIARVVLDGGIWLSRDAAPLVLRRMEELSARSQRLTETSAERFSRADETAAGGALEGLTDRERQVAIEVGRGACNKDIARSLKITDRTVKAHLSAIFAKLGLSDRVQLALYVTRSGPR